MSSHHIDQTDSQASFNVCFTYKAKRVNIPLPNHCVDGTILNTLIICVCIHQLAILHPQLQREFFLYMYTQHAGSVQVVTLSMQYLVWASLQYNLWNQYKEP